MIQDLHSHTYYSFCGKDSPEAVVENAIRCGIEVMGITDHYYGIVGSHPHVTYTNEDTKMYLHKTGLIKYYEHIKTLAHKYRDYITLRCGIEINAADFGHTLMPEGIDVSYFDYCLIEYLDREECVVDDVFAFAKRCGCKVSGIAHTDMPAYIRSKGMDVKEFFCKMAENNIFWELNVNYDSIHNYQEHEYVKNFFGDEDLIQLVRESGLKLSVGFDGHALEDYSIDRVKNACLALEKQGLPMINI